MRAIHRASVVIARGWRGTGRLMVVSRVVDDPRKQVFSATCELMHGLFRRAVFPGPFERRPVCAVDREAWRRQWSEILLLGSG